MATPNNYNDANEFIDFLSKLNPNIAGVINGDAIVARAKKEFKNQTKEGQAAIERLAKNTRDSGHNISAQLQELEKQARDAGYNILFSFDDRRQQIDVKMERIAGTKGDKNTPQEKIKPIKFNIDVGNSSVGYNNGVPATKSWTFQKDENRAYLSTAAENVLTSISNVLKEINKNGYGENASSPSIRAKVVEAQKKALTGLVSHTNHASINKKYFQDDEYEGESRRRQLYMKTNARMAGLIDSVIKDLVGDKKKFTTTSEKQLEKDFNQLQRDVFIYIEAHQSKALGKSVADKILLGRGYSESDVKKIAESIGEDILSVAHTMNLGSDRSMATLTESYEGATDMLLGDYGDYSRHITQGRGTAKKIKGGKRQKIKWRQTDLQKEGHYDVNDKHFEYDAYTSARIDPETVQKAYVLARDNVSKKLRKKIEKEHPEWSKDKKSGERKIQEELEKRLEEQGFLKTFDPSLDDDMIITKRSSLSDMTGTQKRTATIDDELFTAKSKEVEKEIDKLIESGVKSKKLRGRNYDLKNKADREEYKNKLLASKFISGLKPGRIFGDVGLDSIVDEGNNLFHTFDVDQIVGGGQQKKVLTDIGERNYGFSLDNKVFKKVVNELVGMGALPKSFKTTGRGKKKKYGENLDFIRAGGSFKSNEMTQLALSRLGYLFGKSSNKEDFVKKLQETSLAPFIKGLTKDGTGIEFDEGMIEGSDKTAMEEFLSKGNGITELYKWMEKTSLKDLGIEGEDGMVFDPKTSLVYETTAGLSDVFDWTKRVSTSSKERDAQMRTASASGSSSGYKAKLTKRYEGSNEKDKKEIERAERDIKEIQDAITKKNTSTKDMTDEDVAKFISEKSYIAGSKDTSKTAITMGVGDGYTINTEKYKDIIAEYKRGHISKEEFDKTWEAEVQRIKDEMIAAGVDKSKIETIIDPGQTYGFSAFDKQYKGRLLHLGNTSINEEDDPIDPDKKVYNKSEYSSAATSLFKAMGSDGPNKENRISEAATSLLEDMFVTSYSHKGAMNKRANKRRLGHSASFHTSGISPEQIDTMKPGVDRDRLIDSGFISEKAMKKMLMDTHDYEKLDGTIDEEKYLETLYAQYAEADKFKSGKKKAISFDNKRWGETFEDKRNNLIKEIMSIAKSEGLRGMFNRFPSIDSEAVKNSRLFVSKDIKSNDIMKVGSGLAKSINADYDGDTINVILKMLDDYSGDNTEEFDKSIMKRVYNMRGGKKAPDSDEKKMEEYQKALSDADNVFLKEISGLAAKVNNQYIGNFSNMSTSIREDLHKKGYDERDAVYTDGKMNVSSFEKTAKGLIVKGLGQTLEQDAISAKKVAQRITEEIARVKKEKKRELTDDERNELATGVINDFEKLASGIRDGSFESDDQVISELNRLGITKAVKDKDGKIIGHEVDSLGMTTALATIQELAQKNDIDKSIITKLFGGIDITDKDFNGKLDSNIVSKIVSSTSKSIHGGKNGFFSKGDQYHPAAAVARDNNPSAHADKQQITKISDNIEDIKKIKEGNVVFGERGEILRGVVDAYNKEIQMEQLKTVVASKEAVAIEKLGSKYKNLGVVLSEIAKSKNKSIDELTSKDIEEGYRYLPGLKKPVGATQARKMMFSLEDRFKFQAAPTVMDEDLNKALELSKNQGRSLTQRELGETLGLRDSKDINNLMSSYSAFSRGSFIGNTTQLIAELEKIGIDTRKQKGQTTEGYINHLAKLGQGVLTDTSKYPGLSQETANVIKSYVDKDNVDEHGEHSDIVTLFEKLKNAEALFGGIDKSFKTDNLLKSIESLYELLNKLGMLGGNLVGTEVGSSGVINGTPFATTADIVSTQIVSKDGKEYTQLVHSDVKSHGSDNYTAEDAFQVAMEEYGTRDLIKTLASKPEAFSKDDKSFETIQKEIISERYRKAGFGDDQIKNIIDSVPVLTKELASKLVETFNAGLDPNISRLIVSNKNTGNATAYNTKLDFDKRSLLEKVFGGETLSKEEAELFIKSGSFAGTTSKFVGSKKESEKPKTKDDKEAEKKKNQEDFVKLLEQEYKLRLKIAELKGKKASSTNDEEKQNLETLIGYNEGLLNKKITEREKAGKKTGLRGKSGEVYKNNVLSAEEAKYQLELQKLAEKLTKGTGGIAGKKGLFDDFGKQFKGYFVNMFSAYRIISKITQELRKCVQIAKELDKAATNIMIVTGKNRTEVDLLMKSYSGLARELGTTTVAIATSGQEWMRQGYSIEQANDLIVASTHLSKLGMMDMTNATKVLTSTLKGFKMEASEAGDVVDKLTKLDMSYATTAADIGEAMSRTAAIANQMGVSLDETAAMVTTIMDITQQSAEMTGTAIRTLMSRYGNVKSGSFVSMLTDGEDLDKINDIEKVLSVLGIEIRDSKLEMKDISVVLDELALKWKTLSDVEKNAVATAFAGTRQRNQFVVLMDNWQQVEEATEMAQNSAGTADEKYGAFMDSIEARLNKLQTAWEEFTQKLGASNFVKGAVSALTFLVERLDKIFSLFVSISAYLTAKKLWANIGRLGGIFNGLSTIGFKKGAADAVANPNGGIINRIFGTTQKGFTNVVNKLEEVKQAVLGKNGEVLGSQSVVDSMTVTQRAELNKANKLEIKNQKEKLKYLKAEEKIHGFNNSIDKAETQSEIDRLKAQNTALKGKGFNVGDGKTITMRKGSDGNMMYYATTMKAGSDGKLTPQTQKIDPNSTDAQNAQAQKKAQTNQKLAGAAAMGIMAGATFDTNTMNDTGSALGFSYGKGGTTIDDVESTEAEDFLYKTSHGIGSAALSMIPVVGPIVSAVFGPMLSDLFHGLIKWAVHSDEINRKERVRVAKENLEALKKIEDATVEVESAIFNINDAQSMSAAKESVDKLINTLLDDGENRKKIMNELGSKFGFAVDELGNTTMTTADLEKILLYGTDKEKAIATNTINQITNSESAVEKYKSQEEDRFKNEESLDNAIEEATDSISTGYDSVDRSTKGAIMDSLGLYSKEIIAHSDGNGSITYETKRSIVGDNAEAIEKNAETAIAKMREIVEAGEFNNKKLIQSEIDAINAEIKSLEAATKGIDNYNAETEKLNKELHGLELEDAFRSSGLSMWNAVDIANTSLETVIQTFANNLELTGVATRDATGLITEEARQQIETYLRSNEQFSSLFNNGTQTLNDMVSNVSKQNELVSKTGAKSFDELKDAFDRADAKKIEEFSNAAGIAAEELMGLVYKSDSSQLSSFARALNMTTEDVLALQDKLGSITLSDLIKTPAETREAFNELAEIFSEISTKGSATGETLEKLNSNYFNLYNKYNDLGNVISTSSENLLENLRERLFGDAGSSGTQAFLYQNATFQDFKSNSDMYKSYLANLKDSSVWDSLSDDQRAAFTGANTLTDVIHLFNSGSTNGEALQNTLSGFLDSLNLSNDYYTELQNKLVEWQKHDNQMTIDGLQSQIDALDEINEEREREIELIKAKDALENAKKEKKRVYRAGVGWTYEADQEKISEAKDRLDEVEREIDKENLQYQIDLLEKQNSMLDNMAKNEELKALKAVFDEYNTYMKNKFGKEVTSGFSEIIDLAESNRTMTWSTYVENMGTEQAVGEQVDITNMINKANDIAYLDSVLAGMTEGLSGEKLTQMIHSDKYISRQTARKNAYDSFLSSVSNLKASGVDDSTINNYLQSGLEEKYKNNSNYNSTSSYTEDKYGGKINGKYYYLKEGFGTKKGQTDVKNHFEEDGKFLRLVPQNTYSNDQISQAISYLKEDPDAVRMDYYDQNDKTWKRLPDSEDAINSLPNGTILHAGVDSSKTSDASYGYALKDGSAWQELGVDLVEKFSKGTFGVDRAVVAMINELGTEGIVTPQGTLTALPSKTGVVPADLTKNLYNLGEVAPNLIKKLDSNQILQSKNPSNIEDNSMLVENLYATFEADADFDFEKLLISARQYIKNTKGTR